MTRIPPVLEADAEDKTARTYERINELLGTDSVPAPFTQFARVPAFLKDYFMNFKKFVIPAGKLSEKTKALISLGVATQARCEPWAEFFTERAKTTGATDDQIAETIAVASTNAMYNAFFKFRGIAGGVFEGMSVGLRANTFKETSLDETDVELICLTLSDINACTPCVKGHLKKASELGVSDEAVQEAIQVASVVQAGCHFINAT